MNKLKRVFKGNSGQSMVEYGLILALVSIVAIAALLLLGGGISGKFEDVLSSLGGGNPGGSPVGSHVGISTDADYYDWGPLEELGPIPADAYLAGDDDFEKDREGNWLYIRASDPDADDYKPVVVIPKEIHEELVTSYEGMFSGTYVTAVYAADSSAVTSMEGMFAYVKSNSLLVDHMDTSNVTNMQAMFVGIGSPENPITSFTFGNLDTSNVTNMQAMFSCLNISKLDLRRMDTSSVIDMTAMFQGMSTPMRLNVTSFDTRNVELATAMFRNSPVVELDVRNFRSDSMDDVSVMFSGINVPMLDLSQFKLTPSINAGAMFSGSTIDTLDLSGMELAGTQVSDWRNFGGMLGGATVEKAYVKTDVDAVILNLMPGNGIPANYAHRDPSHYYFEGLPTQAE